MQILMGLRSGSKMAARWVTALMLLGILAGAHAQTTATVVWFQEQEPGIAPYPVRYLVTPRFMRSDDGVDSGDFLLFDRQTRKIYSVARDNRTVLEIDGGGALPQKPRTLSFTVDKRSAQGAPSIGGQEPLQVELSAGGEVCRTALVAPGFLEPVRLALQEFSRALAVQQGRTLARTPVEMQTPCFLSRYLYATDFPLRQGMLLADWNQAGERRELTGFKRDLVVDDALFEVPQSYAVMPAAAD